MTQVRSPSRPLLDMSRLLAHHPAKFDQSLPAAHWLHLPEVMIVMMMMMTMMMVMMMMMMMLTMMITMMMVILCN